MFVFAFAIPGLGPISQFFAGTLKVFTSFTGNLALSIILLTVLFRIVVLPLSIKQTKSMIAMQKLQPQLKEIQKKYKDDREKQGQEMMKLYKENKVSPLGGCLPLLIQLPILFALFDVLHNTAKYVHWIKNSSQYAFLGINNIMATGNIMWSGGKIKIYDPSLHKVATIKYGGGEYVQVIVLILLTVITGYISAKMMTTDPKQSKMMAIMPLLMGFFAWILPAGVTIYIIVTNILTALQQYVQLECEGFYDERVAQKKKAGEQPTKIFEAKETIRKPFARILTLLKLKKEPVPSKDSKKEKTRPHAQTQGKKPSQEKSDAKKTSAAKKKVEDDSEVESGATKEAGERKAPVKKGESKDYPAKKQAKKK